MYILTAFSNQEVYNTITSGYECPSPPKCPSHIYDIMLMCWKDSAHERPDFNELKRLLENYSTQYIEWTLRAAIAHQIQQKASVNSAMQRQMNGIVVHASKHLSTHFQPPFYSIHARHCFVCLFSNFMCELFTFNVIKHSSNLYFDILADTEDYFWLPFFPSRLETDKFPNGSHGLIIKPVLCSL